MVAHPSCAATAAFRAGDEPSGPGAVADRDAATGRRPAVGPGAAVGPEATNATSVTTGPATTAVTAAP